MSSSAPSINSKKGDDSQEPLLEDESEQNGYGATKTDDPKNSSAMETDATRDESVKTCVLIFIVLAACALVFLYLVRLIFRILQIVHPLQSYNKTGGCGDDKGGSKLFEDEHDLASNIIVLVTSALHLPEYIFFLRGLYKFTTELQVDISTMLQDTCKYICQCHCDEKKCWRITQKVIKSLILVVYMLVFLGIGTIAIPTTGIRSIFYTEKFNCSSETAKRISTAYEGLALIAHLITVFVRIIMIYFVAMCGVIWSKSFNTATLITDNKIPTTITVEHGVINNDKEEASKKFYDDMTDYEARLKVVKLIYRIFHSWFVFQWLIYTLGLIVDLANLTKTWLDNGKNNDTDRVWNTHTGFNAVFDIFVLLTTYACALTMNSYLKQYIREKQEARFTCDKTKKPHVQYKSKLEYAYLRTTLGIQKIPGSDFKPHIPGTGIDITIDSPGFALGMAIAIAGLILTVIEL